MKKLLFSGALLLSIASFGQGVTVFETDAKDDKKDTKATDSDYSNAIKFGVFNLLRGEFALFYERKINSLMSAEVGAGMTFYNSASNLGIPILGSAIGFDLFDEDQEEIGDEFSKVNLAVGPSFQGLFKFFPKKNAMDGFYLGLNARYSRFNSSYSVEEAIDYYDGYYSSYSVLNSPTQILNSYSQYTDFLLVIGTERLNYAETLYFEWYISVGLRSVKSSSINKDIENTVDYSSGSESTVYNITYTEGLAQKGLLPIIAGGLKLGGFW